MCAKWPLLDYAVKYTFEHADAACQHEVSQDLFFESLLIPAHPYWKTFNRCSWIYLNNILERHQIRRYTSVASFLYIFAEKNLPSLIRTVLNGTPDMDIAGERHRYPLNAAIAQDNEAAIREFLRPAVLPADRCPSFVQSSSTNGNQVDVAKFLLHNASDICSFKPGPVLAWAVAHAEQITIACLVATDKVDLNIYFKIPDWIPWYHVSLIVEAAQLVSLEIHTGGTTNLVPYHLLLRAFLRMPTGSGRLLQAYCLMQNVFNIRDEPLKVPLKVLFDEAGVMEFIIHDKGLDPNQCDAEGRTCLIYAAELGLKSNVKFLLKQNGLDVNAADSWNTTALHYAGKNRHGDIVGMLLGQPNLDINKRNTQGQTALHSAVAGHRSGVLEILLLGQDDVTTVCGPETSTERMEHAINNGDNGHLNQNINTNVMNSWPSLPASPGTDLARAENLAQMRTLNRRKIDVNATDNSGRTALHLAVQCYSRTMVLMLLRRPDINMDIVDKDGVTPMGAAIRLPPLMPQPVLHLRQVHPRYPPFRDPLLQ
jgi:ankyrin repeat protein